MNGAKRRIYFLIAGICCLVGSISATPATLLYEDRQTQIEGEIVNGELWVPAAELAKINGFELKPEGICRGELCIPLLGEKGKGLVKGEGAKKLVNLIALAELTKQAYAADTEKNVWSFSPVPSETATTFESAVAPDFELTDLDGKPHKLSDFRGKKVLLLTWASWCACNLDLPNWQKIYEELKDKNFMIVAAAQDSGGIAAAGKPYKKANATFTTLIDQYHTISTLYNMVNVPTGVWIDEKGNIVRPPETSYTYRLKMGPVEVQGDEYVKALRDWVEKGEKSEYVLKSDKLKEKLKPRDKNLQLADATFRLGVYFHLNGDEPRAEKYWAEAQKLNPDSWNYHRQDWSFTPKEALANWGEKVKALNGKPYYERFDLKEK